MFVLKIGHYHEISENLWNILQNANSERLQLVLREVMVL